MFLKSDEKADVGRLFFAASLKAPLLSSYPQGRVLSEYRTIAEEMPDAYKDVDTVVNAVEEAGLAKRVARLRPHLVIKG